MFITSKFQEFTIRDFEILDSTNDEAKRIILSKAINPDNLIITAKQQTKGRGRVGREWVSEEGNLFASFIFDISKQPNPELYSYFCALAICDLLKKYDVKPELKWPNDVLVTNEKIAGILLEKCSNFLICGVGLNIDSNPEYLSDRKTTSLKSLNIDIDANTALKLLSANLASIKEEYKKNHLRNLAGIIDDLLIKGSAVLSMGNRIKGAIMGIDEEGKMIFKTESGIEKISSGEVFFI